MEWRVEVVFLSIFWLSSLFLFVLKVDVVEEKCAMVWLLVD